MMTKKRAADELRLIKKALDSSVKGSIAWWYWQGKIDVLKMVYNFTDLDM